MSITVKVIFLGLIGFVPNAPEGTKDMAALLVDPVRVHGHEMACGVPTHLPMVVLLEGECHDGDCIQIPKHLRKQARRMGLAGLLPAAGREREILWLLDREALDISGDGDEKLKLQNPFLSLPVGVAPNSAGQSAYFDWVPGLKKLTRPWGPSQVRSDCRNGLATCPLHAYFRLEGGKTGACHMFHDPEPMGSNATERNVRIFNYLVPGRERVQRRAVADAMQVVFDEPGPYVTLRATSLETKTLKREVRIRPEGGKVTLVVANLPGCIRDAKALAERHACVRPHADIFFGLVEGGAVPPAVRALDERDIRRVDPGPCEQEIKAFADFFGSCLLQFPHTITACDGIRYPKSN